MWREYDIPVVKNKAQVSKWGWYRDDWCIIALMDAVCLDVHLSICPSMCMSIYLYDHLSGCPSYLFVCPSICMSIYLDVQLSICPSMWMSIYQYVHLSVCPSICMSIYLYVHLIKRTSIGMYSSWVVAVADDDDHLLGDVSDSGLGWRWVGEETAIWSWCYGVWSLC